MRLHVRLQALQLFHFRAPDGRVRVPVDAILEMRQTTGALSELCSERHTETAIILG